MIHGHDLSGNGDSNHIDYPDPHATVFAGLTTWLDSEEFSDPNGASFPHAVVCSGSWLTSAACVTKNAITKEIEHGAWLVTMPPILPPVRKARAIAKLETDLSLAANFPRLVVALTRIERKKTRRSW